MSDINRSAEPESVKGCAVSDLVGNLISRKNEFWRRVVNPTDLRCSSVVRGGKLIDMAAYKNKFAGARSKPELSENFEA